MSQNNIPHSQTQTSPTGRDESSPSGQQAAREILLLCSTASISPGRKERISQILSEKVDWGYLLELAEFHGIAPLIAHNLITNGLVSQVQQSHSERLSQIYKNTLYRNVILSAEVLKVLSVFSQHGITAIILKGTVLSEQLYGNPALRAVSDMDILVHPEELSLARSLLFEMGYQQWNSEHAWVHPFHEAPYYKKGQFTLFIELHWNLDDQKLVSVPQEKIWHRAQQIQLQGVVTMVLSPEDTLLFLSNHLAKQSVHLLKSLSDIAELLKKYEGALDWDYIIESAHSWGVGTAVYYSLTWAQDVLGVPKPVSLVNALKPSVWRRWALGFLVSQGAFVSPIKGDKLRGEMTALVYSLMMRKTHQTLAVLSRSRYTVRAKSDAWLKAVFWIMLVFGAALGRNTTRFLSRWKWQFDSVKA